MPVAEYPLLSALMAPCSSNEFLEQYWPSRAFVTHGPRERLPATLVEPALNSATDLARNYSGRLRFTHGASERMVQVGDVNPASLLDMGLTVQFVDVERCLQGAPLFVRQLEGELGLHEGAVSMSAFASPRDDGLSCHFDTAELISVQLHGTKRFHFAPVTEMRNPWGGQFAPQAAPFDDLYPQATRGFPDPGTATFESALMRAGSVLFLPRGTWHYTEASENSLSVSIVVDTPSALRCLLDQLRLLLLQDAAWRAPLAGGFGGRSGDHGSRAQSAALLAALPAAIARLSPEDLLTAPAKLEWRLRRSGTDSRYQRTPHTRMEIGPAAVNDASIVTFLLGHRPSLTRQSAQVQVADAIVPVLRWIEAQTGGPFAGATLQAAFPATPYAMLKELLDLGVQTQFLRLLWFPELAPVENRV